ncbi:hypothetical protein GCM10020000_22760 [Streptomyces olivoverticillatus]
MAGVEEAEVDLEVAVGRLAGLVGGAHGVVEGEAHVPDGVPDAVGERRDLRRGGAAVVQEEQVEVAARGELAAAVAADGDEGCALGGAEQGGQPVVGDPGERAAQRRPWRGAPRWRSSIRAAA